MKLDHFEFYDQLTIHKRLINSHALVHQKRFENRIATEITGLQYKFNLKANYFFFFFFSLCEFHLRNNITYISAQCFMFHSGSKYLCFDFVHLTITTIFCSNNHFSSVYKSQVTTCRIWFWVPIPQANH